MDKSLNELAFSLLRYLSAGQSPVAGDNAPFSMTSGGHFFSMQQLAQALKCSRHKIVQVIEFIEETFEVSIHRVRGRGCRLGAPIAWLDAHTIRAHLRENSPYLIEIKEEIESTNAELLRYFGNMPYVLAAERQTAGRGRLGRDWQARLGASLTFSVRWQFSCGAARLTGLSLVVGLVVAQVLRMFGVPAQLKWPNDILLNGAKLGGILIELSGDVHEAAALVIGIGLNFRAQNSNKIAQSWSSLEHYAVHDRSLVLATILNELEKALICFEKEGFLPFKDAWEAMHAWQGMWVRVVAPDGLEGRILGVDVDGALLLQCENLVNIQRVFSGEVSVRLHEAV